jgi:hypothetical protein
MNLHLHIFAYTVILTTAISVNVYGFSYALTYDEQCADRLFNEYLKDAQPEFDKYMDKAINLYDSLNPHSESEINDYIDNLNPLAENYTNDLKPHAQNYIDKLDSCMR